MEGWMASGGEVIITCAGRRRPRRRWRRPTDLAPTHHRDRKKLHHPWRRLPPAEGKISLTTPPSRSPLNEKYAREEV